MVLSRTYNIPIAVCYRKIRELEKLGFLRCVGKKLTSAGKRVKIYQSQVVNAYFVYERGKFRARIQLASGSVENFGGTWTIEDEEKKE